MKKIAVIKEPSFLREGIIGTLSNYLPGVTISAYGSSEKELIYMEENIADLLIIDRESDIDFFEIIELYQKNRRKIIVWLSHLEQDVLLRLFQRGLDGYFYISMELDEFLSAVSTILNGERYVHPVFSSVLLGDYVRNVASKVPQPVGILTKREWEVLELMSQGLSNEEIAQALILSEKTVKNHVSSILKKLNVADRTNAVLFALRQRWCTL